MMIVDEIRPHERRLIRLQAIDDLLKEVIDSTGPRFKAHAKQSARIFATLPD